MNAIVVYNHMLRLGMIQWSHYTLVAFFYKNSTKYLVLHLKEIDYELRNTSIVYKIYQH